MSGGSKHIASLMKGSGDTPPTTPSSSTTPQTAKTSNYQRNPRQQQQQQHNHKNKRQETRQEPSSEHRVPRNPASSGDQTSRVPAPAQAIVNPFPQQGQPIYNQPSFSPRALASLNCPDQLRFPSGASGRGRGRGRGSDRLQQPGLFGSPPQLLQNNALVHNFAYQNRPYYAYATPISQPYVYLPNPWQNNLTPSNRHYSRDSSAPPNQSHRPFPPPARPPYNSQKKNYQQQGNSFPAKKENDRYQGSQSQGNSSTVRGEPMAGAQSEKVLPESKPCTHETHNSNQSVVPDEQVEKMDKLPHPDKLLQDYRSLECQCCQRHFGFQSRAKKELMYCSFDCLGQENVGGTSSPQLTNGSGDDVSSEAKALKTATNAKSHCNERPASQVPVAGQPIKTATNARSYGSGRAPQEDAVDGEMLKTVNNSTNHGSVKVHEEPVKPPRMQPSAGSITPLKEQKPLPGEKIRDAPQANPEPKASQKQPYNPFLQEEYKPARAKPSGNEKLGKVNPPPPVPAARRENSVYPDQDTEEYKEIAMVARTPTVETFTIKKDSSSGPLTVPASFPTKLVYDNTKVSGLSSKLRWGTLELDLQQIFEVSHANSSRDFYIQTYEQSQMADILLDEIFVNLSKQRVPLKNFKLGALCLAPFQENYFRAEIVDIGAQVPPQYTVFFCDYGNEEIVDGSVIFELEPSLTLMNRCTINCVWDMAVAEELGEKEMMAALGSKEGLPVTPRKMIAEGQYLVSVRNFTPRSRLELAPSPASPVELAEEGVVIPIPKKPLQRQELNANAGFATLPVEPKPVGPKKWNIKTCQYSARLKDGGNVRIAFVWDLSRYLINAIEDEVKCANVQDMIEARTYEPLKGVPEIGDILLGLYDGSYYRGQVTELKDGKAHLEFIDYGDKVAVKFDELRLPDEELMEFPIYGMNVVLDGVGEEPRGAEATDEINKICAGTDLRLEFKTKPGNNAKATLWTHDKSLNSLVKIVFAARSGRK